MLSFGNWTGDEDAGFVLKHCVACLSAPVHTVIVRRSELAGFTYSLKATLICTRCGLEREASGAAAQALIRSAVSWLAMVETLSREALDGEAYGEMPAGTEWLNAEPDRELAA